MSPSAQIARFDEALAGGRKGANLVRSACTHRSGWPFCLEVSQALARGLHSISDPSPWQPDWQEC
jgi:hypothetical protein